MSFLPGFLTLLEREIKRFLKVIVQTVFAPLINSALYLLIFGVSLGGQITVEGVPSYLAFIIPGLVMMSALNNAFQNSSSSIISGKIGGDLEDFAVAPLGIHQMLWAFTIGGLIRGAVVGVITYIIGQVFYFAQLGRLMPIEHPFWLLYFIVAGSVIFAQLGIIAALISKTFDQISAVTSFILTPLIYLGGIFFSIQHLHPFWQGVAKVNPLFYLINGFRYGVLGISDVDHYVAGLLTLLFVLLGYAFSLRSLKKSSFTRW
jgi:ABC-2 type transport system permease protein